MFKTDLFRLSLKSFVPTAALVLCPIFAMGQFSSSLAVPQNFVTAKSVEAVGSMPMYRIPASVNSPLRPLSRLALGVGFSPLGIGFQAATNINRHINVRATGSFLDYTRDNISTEGFDVTAKLNLASAGASVDFYPFRAGFRLSPGILFYNQNKVDTIFVAAQGTSFTLDDHTYYSQVGANGVKGKGSFGFGDGSQAFTLTTGWGNVIPASGRHFSFPFEVGVAFTKDPTAALTLTGNVCDSHQENCVDIATDATAQADLAAQVKQYANDFNQLKTYPIVSFGVSYNFRIR